MGGEGRDNAPSGICVLFITSPSVLVECEGTVTGLLMEGSGEERKAGEVGGWGHASRYPGAARVEQEMHPEGN